jgi:serine/threonine protein kinase
MKRREIACDRYELERRAGIGLQGTVYRALDLRTGDVVALKLYDGSFGEEGRKRFLDGAKIVTELRHPGIVRYVDFGLELCLAYLAMEWLEGETLEERLNRGRLGLQESVDLGVRVAEALAAIHERGLVHRDIRARNLFLVNGELSELKIFDIGIERIGGREVSNLKPLNADFLRFMPPEQLRADPMDARADVFALGAVLFRCITGRDAFPGDDTGSVIDQIMGRTEVLRREAERPGVPTALSDLISRMLARKREDRPADGAAVARALRGVLQP